MNISNELNNCILYIEDNLDKEINYEKMAKMIGCSVSTFQRVFSILTGMTVTEYIRRRRLTVAITDINKGEKIIDIALKYGYTSPSSFSRSFNKMHGILPSKIKNGNVKLGMQPVLKFNNNSRNNNISFKIETKEAFILYGIKKEVDFSNIPPVARELWKYAKEKYPDFRESLIKYGLSYKEDGKCYYMCALDKHSSLLEEKKIHKSKWIIFKCKSNNGEDIKRLFNKAYDDYIPNIGFNYSNDIEIEIYYKDYVELLIKIN